MADGTIPGAEKKMIAGILAILLGAVLLTWTSEGQISWDHWQTWLIGALAIATPIVINWLNPADGRYGRGAS